MLREARSNFENMKLDEMHVRANKGSSNTNFRFYLVQCPGIDLLWLTFVENLHESNQYFSPVYSLYASLFSSVFFVLVVCGSSALWKHFFNITFFSSDLSNLHWSDWVRRHLCMRNLNDCVLNIDENVSVLYSPDKFHLVFFRACKRPIVLSSRYRLLWSESYFRQFILKGNCGRWLWHFFDLIGSDGFKFCHCFNNDVFLTSSSFAAVDFWRLLS